MESGSSQSSERFTNDISPPSLPLIKSKPFTDSEISIVPPSEDSLNLSVDTLDNSDFEQPLIQHNVSAADCPYISNTESADGRFFSLSNVSNDSSCSTVDKEHMLSSNKENIDCDTDCPYEVVQALRCCLCHQLFPGRETLMLHFESFHQRQKVGCGMMPQNSYHQTIAGQVFITYNTYLGR